MPIKGRNDDVSYILKATPRLAQVSSLTRISFGLADGVNKAIKQSDGNDKYADGWHQAAIGFQHDTLMMAAMRVCLLLDKDTVSFQSVYHRLKDAAVGRSLIEQVFGGHEAFQSMFGPSPTEMRDSFLALYSQIDWEVYSRLVHFRNYGIAHLLDRKNWKSITYDELRHLVSLVGQMGDKLTELCRAPYPTHEPLMERWTQYGFQALTRGAMDRRQIS